MADLESGDDHGEVGPHLVMGDDAVFEKALRCKGVFIGSNEILHAERLAAHRPVRGDALRDEADVRRHQRTETVPVARLAGPAGEDFINRLDHALGCGDIGRIGGGRLIMLVGTRGPVGCSGFAMLVFEDLRQRRRSERKRYD